ncbi:hypothetical protein [Pseudomonas sp. EL_65y_Pfl1_R83]|uniref:hypothetical protein n=2 Tax=unclassified Pseudomonas TaxID=196821 RepID=UPI0030DD60BA
MRSRPMLYTNEVSSAYLSSLDDHCFTEQQLAEFNEHALEVISQRQFYLKTHPAVAVYRVAAVGSQTRNGGTIKQTTSAMTFKLTNGERVRAAHKGDYVEYVDGSQAHILTGAGESNSNIALVGSLLSNGDEIINTPQGSVILIAREGVQLAEDFLPLIQN